MLRNRWFRRLIKALLILLAGWLYLRWANNVQPLHGPSSGYRYAHWLFTPTPFLFLAAGFAWLVTSCGALLSTFGLDSRERAGRRWWIALWLLYATVVLCWATLSSAAIGSIQRTVRQSVAGRTYVLQGTSGGSGNMFYHLYDCDRLELVCRQLNPETLVRFLGPPPDLIVDHDKQQITVIEKGETLFTASMQE